MPPRSKKHFADIGTMGLVAICFTHPSQNVRDKFPNCDKVWSQQNKTKFYLTGKTQRIINWKMVNKFTFTSKDFKGVDELYAMRSQFVIINLGNTNE